MGEEQEFQLNQLIGQREQLEKDRDLLKQNTDMLQAIAQGRFQELQRLEGSLGNSATEILEIKEKISEKRAEVETEKRRKEELEASMKDLRAENDLKQEELAG